MKQVFLRKGTAFIEKVPLPELQETTMLVRVHYSFISSGTESASLSATQHSLAQKALHAPLQSTYKVLETLKEHGFQGTMALLKGKAMGEIAPIGYSCAGTVLAIGSKIRQFRVGDLVTCAGAGLANHADVVSVPENLAAKITNKEILRSASLTTIGAIALQGIRRADLRLGETVCVIGLGLLGQLTVQLARLSGCTVFGIDINESRFELAKHFGASACYNPTTDSAANNILFATNHHGVDTTIITAGSSSDGIIQQAMELTRRKGRVVLVGDVPLSFERNPFYTKEIDFLISCSYGPGRYDSTYEQEGHDYPYAYVRWTEQRNMQLIVNLIEKKKLIIDPLISHEYPIDQVSEAYQALQSKEALGIVLRYIIEQPDIIPQDVLENIMSEEKANAPGYFLEYKKPHDTLRLAIIGAGGFAKVKLLPLIQHMNNVLIDTIIDTDPANAINVARQYHATNNGSLHTSVCHDPAINAVIIASPHALHSKQALDCLAAGKAVFLEKPAAVTFEQLELLQIHLDPSKQLFCVDFNRSWAPVNQLIAQAIASRSTPLIIHYRMNAGFIPKNHWIQSDYHGGRIIGEACHIFELFCFLTQSKPINISVETINSKQDNILIHDNISTHIRFEDGSCCNLVYTALGSNKLSKERMEIFFDGKALVMDDYQELKGYDLPARYTKKWTTQDKGHADILKAFITAAHHHPHDWPIPLERILMATRISLLVDQLARQGGGHINY